DLVRALADGADADHVWSGDVMSLETVVAAPDDTVAAVAHQMVTLRIRHVPVRRGSDVLGLVSIRDVVGALLDTVPAQR
ncbi:MAG: CBS domain-containing protein, partial [Pseudonocardia sp.]